MDDPGINNNSREWEHGPVWDCHIHCYPDEVIADPNGFARKQGEAHWLALVSDGPQGWAGPEDLIRAMDRDGIEKSVLQAWYWENPETCRIQNEWHAQWLEKYPDRLMACAAIHPDSVDPVAELGEAEQWGARAVGECLPVIQSGTGWGHPAWEDVINWTTARGWPMAVHLTEPVGHEYPGRVETPLMDMVDMFEQHPDQKWICAHWGGGLPFHALNRRVRKALRNVWFDSAAGPLLYSEDIWRIAGELVGMEKIIFGSDFPLLLYPRRERQPGWSGILGELGNAGLSQVAIRAIVRENLQAMWPTD